MGENKRRQKMSSKKLNVTSLLEIVRHSFSKIKGIEWISRGITSTDCLMSGLALFGLKYPSLLQFNSHYSDSELIQENMRTLYKVEKVPSDTYMRERLDEIDHRLLRKPFSSIFAMIQRSGELEQFQYLNGFYLCSVDGSGFFSSSTVHCENCCVKKHKDGSNTYYHQMLCGAIVHPNQKTVIPFAPEPIMKSDGTNKNDCENNAFKRFIVDLRREHPHLNIIIVADSLTAKAPRIRELQNARLSYIMSVKEGDHKTLFAFALPVCETLKIKITDGITQHYRFVNDVPVNDNNHSINVNFLDYTEINSKGDVVKHFTWITDIRLTKKTVESVMQGGRARWKIENETFNTLKNQGYEFEHNFGHGKHHLSSVFATLMLLAFMIDQVQELGDNLFKGALKAQRRKKYLWEHLRGLFFNYIISNWEDIWNSMIHGKQGGKLVANTT